MQYGGILNITLVKTPLLYVLNPQSLLVNFNLWNIGNVETNGSIHHELFKSVFICFFIENLHDALDAILATRVEKSS